MSDIEEKRVYGDRRAETVAVVATGHGVATVRLSGDQVGRFGLADDRPARDVATGGGRAFAATADGVVAGFEAFDSLGFGPAVAVTVDADTERADPLDGAGTLLAADEDGTVARYRDGEWAPVGSVGPVRALSGPFVAAADGVYRVADGGLTNVGLSAVRDVAAESVPLAATDDGLYRLGNGWLEERAGAFRTVAASAESDSAHAATAETLLAATDGEWAAVDLPVTGSVTGVAYGECTYAVTRSGTVLVEADPDRTADGAGGWRSRTLGLPEVAAIAVL